MPAVTVLKLGDYLTRTLRQIERPRLAPTLKALEMLAVADTQQRFNLQKAPDGTPWAPLKHARIITAGGVGLALLDTGQLRASIRAKASDTELVVSSNKEYAGVHQYGGTIRPVRAKFLCIPLTREAKYAGSPRRFRGTLFPILNRARTKGVLVERRTVGRGKSARTVEVEHFFMTKSVTIPARPFLGFSLEFLRDAEEILTDAVNRWVKPAA